MVLHEWLYMNRNEDTENGDRVNEDALTLNLILNVKTP